MENQVGEPIGAAESGNQRRSVSSERRARYTFCGLDTFGPVHRLLNLQPRCVSAAHDRTRWTSRNDAFPAAAFLAELLQGLFPPQARPFPAHRHRSRTRSIS